MGDLEVAAPDAGGRAARRADRRPLLPELPRRLPVAPDPARPGRGRRLPGEGADVTCRPAARPAMPAAQLRYFSICVNDFPTTRYVACLPDERITVDRRRLLHGGRLRPRAQAEAARPGRQLDPVRPVRRHVHPLPPDAPGPDVRRGDRLRPERARRPRRRPARTTRRRSSARPPASTRIAAACPSAEARRARGRKRIADARTSFSRRRRAGPRGGSGRGREPLMRSSGGASSRMRPDFMPKYSACGWWATIATVDCSGSTA